MQPGPGGGAALGPGSVLGVMVMMMVGVMGMMVHRGSERRGGKHHQQQGSGKNLLHGMNVARGRLSMGEEGRRRTKWVNRPREGAAKAINPAQEE
jgi:hypothetical protein